jgi:adenine-specific DNA-methyltransferase
MKKTEIADFIEIELFEIIEKEIKTLEDSQILKEKLATLQKEIETVFGCSLEEAKESNAQAPKIKEYMDIKEQLKASEKKVEMEEELYNHIINFFSRYYDNGDFISKRRYSKKNKYAIPYNGEEVYLYWANHDQYYIKTSENFNNYSFKVDDATVEFIISNDELELEKGNIKDIEKKFFIFHDLNYDRSNETLTIQFAYRGLTEEEQNTVKKLVEKKTIKKEYVDTYNFNAISGRLEVSMIPKLMEKHIRMNGEPSELNELNWHLNKYTTKNTSDYFIHKDLKGFLSQELDFYIKNEMFHIDDLESRDEISLNLICIKVFKTISLKIIRFLAQIENFQKKLWEKKKFIISTDYCITLDYIDEEYYSEILENDKQLDEWRRLFNFDIDTLKKSNSQLDKFLVEKSNDELEILKKNKNLLIDTRFFNWQFKIKILSNISELDTKINGILINSENFHALNLIANKFNSSIDCIYVDPPYNTSENTFIYKNNYRDSSWLSMVYDRIFISKSLLSNEGVLSIAIDDTENAYLASILNYIFDKSNHVATIPVEVNPAGQNIRPNVPALSHDYFHVYAKDINKMEMGLRPLTKEEKKHYPEHDEIGNYTWDNLRRRGGNSRPRDRPNQWFPIYVDQEKKIIKTTRFEDAEEIWPIDPKGIKRIWRYNKEGVNRELAKNEISFKIIEGKIRLLKKSRIPEGKKPKTLWYESKYSATTHGTKLLINILGENKFSYPKSVFLVKDIISYWTKQNSIVLDYFSGSGTTGHAVLKLNREDGGNRKFILIEMGQYFTEILKTRILKTIYSDNWKDGKIRDYQGSTKQIVKYHSLEQYEDSLLNINFTNPSLNTKNSKNYTLKYMFDYETKDNQVFLNIDQLDNPFEYKLKIQYNNEIKDVSIDLIETFNYIGGIIVSSLSMKKKGEITYIFIKGHREGKSVIVIWRNKPDSFNPELDKEFVEEEIGNDEYYEILVNGNSLIRNAKSIDEIIKANMFR